MPPGTRARCSEVRQSTLTGGMRLVSDPMDDVASVAIGFWVGSGSRDEPEVHAGASHFLEHLLFKGTPERSASSIAEAVDEVGGDCNAFTSKEHTVFYIRLLAEHTDLGLDILSDIMRNPALRAEDVDSERRVILDEILMHADDPSDRAAEQWMHALFPDHPLGRDTLGTADSVVATTADDVRRFFDAHYRPGNVVAAVAGACDHDALVAGLERRFAGRSGGGAPRRAAPAGRPQPLAVDRRPTEQEHMVYGMRSVARGDPRRFAAAVLDHALGGGLSSRLFQKVREQRGLAYSVWSERAGFEETGTLAVVMGTAPEHAAEVLRIVAGEIDDLAASGITDRELLVARSNLRAEALLSGEDSGARMSRIGSSLLLHGEVLPVAEVLARIDAVTPGAVQEVARDLAEAPRSLSIVGPVDPEQLPISRLRLATTIA